MHSLKTCHKNHYLLACDRCLSFFHVSVKDVKFEKVLLAEEEKKPIWRSTTLVQCPGCIANQPVRASRWYWWPRKSPTDLHSLYDKTISCDFGKITHIQIYAPSKNFLFFSSSSLGHVRGAFLSEDTHFKVLLDKHCERHEHLYVLKPFSILITSNNLIMYRIDDVNISEAKPFVLIKEEENYGLLSRTCDFAGRVVYLDPIFTPRTK